MRVLYLTQWFEPEPVQKGIDFAKALRDAGHEVRVATGFPNYPGGRVYSGYRIRWFQRTAVDGVTVDRLPLYPSHDQSALRRSLNYISFFLSALIYGLIHARKFDVVYVYHPPIMPALAAALFGWVWRVPFVIDIQDLWPDSVSASGMADDGRVSRALSKVCAFVYRRASVVAVQSEGFMRLLQERGVPAGKLVRIYNWADEAQVQPKGELDLTPYAFQGRRNFVYAGNLGRAQALESLIEAAQLAAATSPEIQLLLIGGGVEADHLTAFARDLGATNVNIMPAVQKDKIADVLAAADVLVLHLADKPLYASTVPSKLQFYLASGRPVLAAVRGEAAALVERAGAGMTALPQDPTSIAAAMVALAGQPRETLEAMGVLAHAYYMANMSYSKAISATERVLEQATASTTKGPKPR